MADKRKEASERHFIVLFDCNNIALEIQIPFTKSKFQYCIRICFYYNSILHTIFPSKAQMDERNIILNREFITFQIANQRAQEINITICTFF